MVSPEINPMLDTKSIFVHLSFFAFLISFFADCSKSLANDDGTFNSDVAPILIKRCVECHNATESSGGLDLTKAKSFQEGGDSGEELFNSKLEENYLLDRIVSGEMPPEERGVSKKLPLNEVAAIKKWIRAGAKWPVDRELDLYEFTNEVRGGRDWWSFQPIKSHSVPIAKSSGTKAANPIDAFVIDQHQKKGLSFAPTAPKTRIFRRLTFDVTGLPPDYNDMEKFVRNKDPDAYSQMVDKLLGSPRFGENLGRDWLDLVRYADTNGYERDADKKFAWKYRDYVIESFNSDKPFNEFVMQQLAGDQMTPLAEQNVVATTMLRLGTWDDEPNDKLEYKYDRLEDLIHVTSTAFLGLTVKCARCHDHKFDPIPQTDYYRVATMFWPGDLIGNSSEKVKGFDAFGWTDQTSSPTPVHLLKKGNPRDLGQVVRPGFLSVMKPLDRDFEAIRMIGADADPDALPNTGRRLEFAKRLVDPKNPLVARVTVNRIWQHYFGYGLVRSVNNFGYKGELPTHPKLLDWLANELIRNQWNMKPIHRLILMSQTYRQDSVHPEASKMLTIDPLNKMLWRMNRRRLKAESIRDTFLALSGDLNLQMQGRGFTPEVSEEALEGLSRQAGAWNASPKDQQARRGAYMYVKRSLIPPLIANFDFADSTRPCGQRDFTIVAPQALALMNNRFVHDQSSRFASRISKLSTSKSEKVRFAMRLAFGREPSNNEIKDAVEFIAHQQQEFESQRKANQIAEQELKQESNVRQNLSGLPVKELKLHLDAGRNLVADKAGNVLRWTDRSRNVFAVPVSNRSSPKLLSKAMDNQPAIAFNGIDQFLEINSQVLDSAEFTIVLVGHDTKQTGSREFFSNWNRNGNSTSSVFLGLTDGRAVRFSDQFRVAGPVSVRPFLMTAITAKNKLAVYIGRRKIGQRNSGLADRKLDTKYVLGTQGNFGSEYLKGWLAEILVYDRAISDHELESIWNTMEAKYPSIATKKPDAEKEVRRTPESLAFASFCHVLFNSNELIFVD